MISADLLALLCCPQCHSDLIYDEKKNTLACTGCGAVYSVKDDIPLLIPPSSSGSAGE
jgi:uncharacterized protein YbaR (Trm112 family)